MQNRVIEHEVEALLASIRHRLKTLNALRSERGFCVRQEPAQQRLVEQLETRFLQLKHLDPDNGAEYDRKLAVLKNFVFYEKPSLKLVA